MDGGVILKPGTLNWVSLNRQPTPSNSAVGGISGQVVGLQAIRNPKAIKVGFPKVIRYLRVSEQSHVDAVKLSHSEYHQGCGVAAFNAETAKRFRLVDDVPTNLVHQIIYDAELAVRGLFAFLAGLVV